MPSVLLAGLGDIGEHMLEILARTPGIRKIYTVDIAEDPSLRRIYSARAGAAHLDFYPHIEYKQLNLNDVDATAKYLKETNPDIILSAVTLLTWWAPEALCKKKNIDYQKLDEAGFGAWLPLHLALVYKLMQAVKKANINPIVVNASFPDAVNAILAKVGLGPTIGLGNCDLFIPEIKKIVADEFGVSMKSVTVYLVGHHYLAHVLNYYKDVMGVPYYLRIFVDGKDVTDHFNTDELLVKANQYMPKGADDHFIVAASGVKNALGIYYNTKELTYAPGPQGLPGGYPVRLTRKGPIVVLLDDITLEEAIKINEKQQELDGIKEIKDDGTVAFTEKTYKIMKDLLGYDCKELPLSEVDERARELLTLFKQALGE